MNDHYWKNDEISFEKQYKESQERLPFNEKLIGWYKQMHYDAKNSDEISPEKAQRFYNKSMAVSDCCKYWDFNSYKKSKILNYKRVYRCNDRFCANCAKVRTVIAMNKLVPKMIDAISKGYTCYFVTLTIPTVYELSGKTIVDFRENIAKFVQKFDHRRIERPIFWVMTSVFSIEITKSIFYRRDSHGKSIRYEGWHPHAHGLIFVMNELSDNYINKDIPDGYDKKRKKDAFRSRMDEDVRKVWTGICLGLQFKTSLKLDDFNKIYRCDVILGDEKSPIECFKYLTKMSDIHDYKMFCDIYNATFGRQLFQTYGDFRGIDLDEETDEFLKDDPEKVDKLIEILQEYDEKFEDFVHLSYISTDDISKDYSDYKKVSTKVTLNKKIELLKEMLLKMRQVRDKKEDQPNITTDQIFNLF